MKFVDLFAGLGGFHIALRELGHECVFACEIDETLRDVYELNFGLRPVGDIRDVSFSDVPQHDVVCAGFPCQPFSKAGSQMGFGDQRWGDLFGYVLRLIELRLPMYILLENVPNLKWHQNGKTWENMYTELSKRGYEIAAERLSPHQFGIPQIRERMFIVGSRAETGLWGFRWPEKHPDELPLSIATILDHEPADARRISTQVRRCLEAWQDFIKRFPSDEELPSFPIWSMEFGATYPYETTTPHALGVQELRAYCGSHGRLLRDLSDEEVLAALPSYARTQQIEFPAWKARFIRQNRDLYARHKAWMDEWVPQILEFPPSFQKLEWNCKGEERDLWRYLIQCRPSGVRVKRPRTAPSLVAMTDTQVPIVAWEGRYLTPRECARLQSMGELELPASRAKAFTALGNAVNTRLVGLIANALVGSASAEPGLRDVS